MVMAMVTIMASCCIYHHELIITHHIDNINSNKSNIMNGYGYGYDHGLVLQRADRAVGAPVDFGQVDLLLATCCE